MTGLTTLGSRAVYNLEVQVDHVYHVSTTGLLVHNVCAGRHHFIPVSLGNRIPYGHNSLPFIGSTKHTHLQDSLNSFLARKTKDVGGTLVDMHARKGNPGALVQRNFSAAERTAAIDEFYRGFEGGR